MLRAVGRWYIDGSDDIFTSARRTAEVQFAHFSPKAQQARLDISEINPPVDR